MVSPKELSNKLDDVKSQNIEEGTSLFSDSMRKFRKNRMALMSCIAIALMFTASIFAKYVTPYSYDEGLLEAQNMPPTWYKEFMSPEHKEQILAWVAADESATIEDGGMFDDEASDEAAMFDDDGEAAMFDDDSEVSEDATMFAEADTNEDDIFSQELDLDAGIVNSVEQPIGTQFFDRSINHLDAQSAASYMAMGRYQHILGTDELGQDIFSRLIYGIRLSLFLALTVTLVSLIVGVAYGSISGYFGGFVDQAMMRVVDFLFGVPFIFLIILLMVLFGRHVFLIFIGLGLVYWITLARIVRGQILSIKEKEFVMAARSNGVSQFKIIFKHLVPNVIGPVIIFATLLVPQIMLLEAFLSFIGLGVTPPDVSLGILISDGANVLSTYSWPIVFPGIIFSLMIFCMNFIGDGLRDALDPKLR